MMAKKRNTFYSEVEFYKVGFQTYIDSTTACKQTRKLHKLTSLVFTSSLQCLCLRGMDDEATINHRFRTENCEQKHSRGHPNLNLILVGDTIPAVFQQNTEI